jgi:hypothetical protein
MQQARFEAVTAKQSTNACSTHLDTPLAELGLDLSVDPDAVRIGDLRLRKVDPEKILALAEKRKTTKSDRGSSSTEEKNAGAGKEAASTPKGISSPLIRAVTTALLLTKRSLPSFSTSFCR